MKEKTNSKDGEQTNGRTSRGEGGGEQSPAVDGKRVAELEAELALYRHALNKAREEMQAFAYSVSHDLRAPLRAIEGFSKILLEDFSKDLPAEAGRFLKHITTNTQQLASQVDDLLKLYRSGKNAPSRVSVDAGAVCQEAVAEAKRDSKTTVQIEQQELPRVYADPVQLRQVFRELINNAIKFSRGNPSPKIQIWSEPKQDAIVFFVEDNGTGFDAKNLPRLFQVFQKLHSGPDFPGNGIGLAIVKRLVEAHGGTVAAEASPDKGAKFSFTLPRVEAPEAEIPGGR